MDYLYSRPKILTIICLVSQILFTVPAFAAGYQLDEMSPSLQGASTAGAAAANNDVSAMFINPATLSTLKQNQAYLGGSEIFPNISMSQASAIHTVNIPGLPPSNITAPVLGLNSQNSISKPAFVPDGYLSWRINEKLVAGLALVAPYGLTTKYYEDSVVRFAAVNSSVRSINITPAISYAINKQWAVGFGIQAQYLRAVFSNFNGPYTGTALDTFFAATNPTYLKADGWGMGVTLGVLYKPDLCTRLGIGYRSQVTEQLNGKGQQYTSPGGTVPAPSRAFLFNAETSVNAAIHTPDVLTISAERDINDWTLKGSIQVNFWDTFDQLTINMPDAFATQSIIQTRWRNAWLAAVGADYRATDAWTIRGGVAYDETPTTNYRDPRIPDTDRVWTTIGTSYAITKNFSIDGAYEHIFLVNNPTVNVTQASGSSLTSTVPLEVNQVYAKYKGSVDIVALAVRYNF